MYVEYRTIIEPVKMCSDPNIRHECVSKTPCCEEMARTSGGREDFRVIGFEEHPERHVDHPAENDDVSICLFRTKQWDNGEVTTTSIPIDYCPFCGTSIELEEVDAIRDGTSERINGYLPSQIAPLGELANSDGGYDLTESECPECGEVSRYGFEIEETADKVEVKEWCERCSWSKERLYTKVNNER